MRRWKRNAEAWLFALAVVLSVARLVTVDLVGWAFVRRKR